MILFLLLVSFFFIEEIGKIKYLCAFDIYYDEIANITIDHRFEYHKSFIHSIILSSMYPIHIWYMYRTTCVYNTMYEAFIFVTILSRHIITKRQYNTLQFL